MLLRGKKFGSKMAAKTAGKSPPPVSTAMIAPAVLVLVLLGRPEIKQIWMAGTLLFGGVLGLSKYNLIKVTLGN